MTRLVFLLLLLVAGFFGWRHYLAPIPLESHFLASIPVKVRMLPEPNTASRMTGQVSVEQVVNQKAENRDMTLVVLAMGTAFDVFDEQDINELSLEDFDSISRRFGTDHGINASIIRRGFIEHNGKKGYELVINLGEAKGELVQHIYTHDNHLLLLMASYAGNDREKQTALAFLDSVEFL